KNRRYFDSYGQVSLAEVQSYLKEKNEKEVIQRNTDIVQHHSNICGHLCLFVLKALSIGWTFREILDKLTLSNLIIPNSGSGIKWTSNMADELHKPVRKKFLKRFVFVRQVDDIWGADLVDMQTLSKKNNGFKYILMVIDIFSKYGWALPLKTKTGREVADAFKIIFKDNTPKKLWTDKGKEFYNKEVSTLLKKHNIHLYSTHNDEKCSVIERWNRTIKDKLWKYFSANGTYKYLDILNPLIQKYNLTKHRSIGFTPTDARKPSNYQQVFKNLYFKKVQQTNTNPKFKVGDRVRITVKKNIFAKGFTINWTDKIYTISQVLNTLPPTYIIKDRDEEVKGTFYEQELQKTNEELFRIEKVIRWKKLNGQKMGRVKWIGYDSTYNSWLPETEIKDI
ncbi:MAG: hypothetical protein MK200_07280, partial [Nitrosopumilus sp.]|nr:hypothetical protein [Nitrosopumilus sp.]